MRKTEYRRMSHSLGYRDSQRARAKVKKFLWLFILVGVSAHAQSSFLIPVTTTTGQAVPGASVQLQCQSGGCGSSVYTSTADATGNAVFSNVQAGRYTVTTFGAGVQTYSYTYDVSSPNPSSLNNIIFVDGVTYSLADVGAGLNAAITAAQDGQEIILPAQAGGGCYQTSTPVVHNTLNKHLAISGAGLACINYVPTTATSFLTVDCTPTSGGGYKPCLNLSNLIIINNNCVTNDGCGSSATGINIGPTNGGDHNGVFERVYMFGFGTDINVVDANSASWGLIFRDVNMGWSTTGYSQANSEENVSFEHCLVAINGTGFNFATATSSSDITISKSSIDSNTTGINTNSSRLQLNLIIPHFEDLNVAAASINYIVGGMADVHITDGEALDDATTGTSENWFTAGLFEVKGLSLSSGGRNVSGQFVFIVNTAGDIDVMDKSPSLIYAETNVQNIAFVGTGTCLQVFTGSQAPLKLCGNTLQTKSSAYTLTFFDQWINVTGTTTITVPHGLTNKRWVVFNSGSNTVTVAADSGNTNGGASISLSANTGKECVTDGTNVFCH